MDEPTKKEMQNLGQAIFRLIELDGAIEAKEEKLSDMYRARDRIRDKIGVKLWASLELRALENLKGETALIPKDEYPEISWEEELI